VEGKGMGERKSILIVGHSGSASKSLVLIFDQNGYTIDTAGTGHDALEKAKRQAYTAAFLDTRLPDMEGTELIKALKDIKPDTVLIMVTTYADLEEAKQALKKGASAYVIKALDSEEVLAVFGEAFEMQHLLTENKRLYEEAQRELAERRLTDQALKKSEEKYRTLFEDSRDAIVITNKKGRLLDMNQSALDLFGYSREELLGMRIGDLYADIFEDRRIQKELEQKGYAKDVVSKLVRKNGSERHSELTVSVKKYGYDSVIGYQSIIRDISERKRLEEQLFQSQKMEAIGRLAGGVAHDFNNLLTTIIGHSDIMLMDLTENSPFRADLEGIRKASDRAAALTRQLLAFSRRQVLQPKVLDLNKVIADTEKMLRRLIGEDVELSTVFGQDIGRVKVDPGQMEQVILNLAVNARDAMPDGGRVTIETTNVDLDDAYVQKHHVVVAGPYLMMAVSDTGVGMDKETQSQIFDPFFTTKEQGQGTGLGLSTVYGIVKQSGGYIWVYSEPDVGTTFKIYLPRVEEEAELLQKERVPKEVPCGSETILLVEDDEMVLRLAGRILNRHGYKVLEAPNAEEALRIGNQYEKPIHLILTDVVMPGMSGRALAERMRDVKPEAKVLFMSGYTDHAIVHHGVLDKEVTFFQKPFASETLLLKVREVLDKG
jgi:two-component system cell cycle sensor histidine kinase/response regulator CckA